MPLTPDEIDKIRETEILKNDIQKALSTPKKESKLTDFQQQVVLLILAFIFTTLAGGALTAWWKSRESENQRRYLEKQRALDRAYSLISQTSKEVATTVAAADDVVAAYYPGWSTKDINERHDNWTKTSREWRIKAQVLRSEIPPTFPDPAIREKFEEIIKTRRQLGNKITNLPRGKKAIQRDKDLEKEISDATDLAYKITDLLYECIDRMTKQVNRAGQ